MEAYETIEKEGFVAKIFPDECAENPIEEWDGNGRFYHWKDYGKEQLQKYCELLGFDSDSRLQIGKSHYLDVEIDKYEHSSVSYSVKGEGYQCRWDTSNTWAVWFPDESAMQDIMSFKTKNCQRKLGVEIARDSWELFNQWANGDVYGFQIEDENGNNIDGCWGFYGMESVKEEVNSQLDY